MLKKEMKNVLIRYLFFLVFYLIISLILPNLSDKAAFIAINVSFAIIFLITYIKNKDK